MMKPIISKVAFGVVFMLATSLAHAVQVSSFNTSFSASESLWQGTGIPATGFDTGNIRIPPSGIGVQVRAFANTGTVSSNVNGSLSATYDELISFGDSANVELNFLGGGSNISSAFGAQANLDAFVAVNGCLGPVVFGACVGIPIDIDTSFGLSSVGASLTPSRSFTADLGTNSGSASDQVELVSVGALPIPLTEGLGASVDLEFRQTISLDQQTMDGTLRGINTRNGQVVERDFNLGVGGTDSLALSLAGLDVGLWNFSILDLDLFGLFKNTASLVVEPTVRYIIGSDAIASFPIDLITNSFLLDFNTLRSDNLFSILVTPIPAAAWLFATALIGFVGFARRRKIS